MKTVGEWWLDLERCKTKDQELALIEARDAEHAKELAEARAENDALMVAHKESAERAIELEMERDRLRGELAEARRLLEEIPGTFAPGGWIKRRDAFLAAPSPAESPCTASAGSCNSLKACGEAGKCIDARMRETLNMPAESTGAPMREQMRQAFGEPVNTGRDVCAHEDCDGYRMAMCHQVGHPLFRHEFEPFFGASSSPVVERACTCGSGAHPRRCSVHPWGFQLHCLELSVDALRGDVDALKLPPAAPPDDIGERVAQLETAVKRDYDDIVDHERRLKALEERYDVLSKWNGALAKMAEGQTAPQEQAGHADPVCAFGSCGVVRSMHHPRLHGHAFVEPHTGAKP